VTDRIRRVGISITLAFLAVFVMLNYLQILEAKDLAANPINVRPVLRDYQAPRGDIIAADGTVVATSVATVGQFERVRSYPTRELFGQITGWFSFAYGAAGVEDAYNGALNGRDEDLRYHDLTDLVLGRSTTGEVHLTVRADAQRLAQEALIGPDGQPRQGAVVVIEPSTGAVIAMYSNPALDPTLLSDPDFQTATAAFDFVEAIAEAQGADSRLDRSYRERFPPGSTFKVVTGSWAIEQGLVTPETPFPVLSELDLPQTTTSLPNFGGAQCGGTLAASLARSCNTVFGQIGLDLGERLLDGMHAFGIGEDVPFDLPGAATASTPPAGSFEQNQPQFAFAAIGQGNVSVSPLQMAMVAAGIANDGVIMRPHAIDRIETSTDHDVIRQTNPEVWRTAVSPQTAEAMTQMMIGVVNEGSGTQAQLQGVQVAGKTGTAQTSDDRAPHTWFIGFAPAEAPQYAIAVLIENGGNLGDEATGGSLAAPAAAHVLGGLLGVAPA
jgi:penicillin-binding protein A